MPSTVRCAALLAVPAVCGLVAPPTRPSRTRLHSTVTQDLGTTTAPLLDDAATARAVAAMREDARTKPLSDDELTWFARDRRGDAREAVEKVVQYLRWRKDRGGLGADRDALMRRAAPEARRRVGYLAREKDALNRPTVVVVARRHDAMRRDLKASQALCVAVLEDAIAEAVKEGGEQVLALVDLRQVGPQNVDVPFLLWLIMTLRSYFPKRLGQVALVDPPPVLFEAAWNLIKGAVGRHADMVRLVSSADVRNAYFAGKRVPPDLR
uniref:CRAL-TRIO domain-containing protein n=1 Tax=Pelagomonas calceolata TaxID=35677 RepID=A0A7S3ZKL2_9STRA